MREPTSPTLTAEDREVIERVSWWLNEQSNPFPRGALAATLNRIASDPADAVDPHPLAFSDVTLLELMAADGGERERDYLRVAALARRLLGVPPR